MTVIKRVQRLSVAAAVLSAGAVVAGPATAAPAGHVQASSNSVSASAASSDAARGAKKIHCRLGISFKPRVGKGDKHIRSGARTICNVKVPKIWTSVRLVQTKAKDRYKLTSTKHRAKRNSASVRTFCPKEYRRYKVVGKTTIKMPKSAGKKFIKLRKVGHQRGVCRT